MNDTDGLISKKNSRFNFIKFLTKIFQKGGVYISLIILLIFAGIFSP